MHKGKRGWVFISVSNSIPKVSVVFKISRKHLKDRNTLWSFCEVCEMSGCLFFNLSHTLKLLESM